MIVGVAGALVTVGCALIPAAVDADLGPRAGVSQHAVGVGNVSTETPISGVTAFWAADSLAKLALAAAVGVGLVVLIVRKFVSVGSRKCKCGGSEVMQ
jgi:hypothetical protein